MTVLRGASRPELVPRTWGKGFSLGLFCGLSLMFALGPFISTAQFSVLRYTKYTNLYGIEAAAGATIGLSLILRTKRMRHDWRFSPLWICLGLVFWTIGQIVWLTETIGSGITLPYPDWSDLPYLLSDVSFIIAVFMLSFSLKRRILTEVPTWGFLITLGASLTIALVVWLNQLDPRSNRSSGTILNVGGDLAYFFLSEFLVLLTIALVRDDNSRLPAQVHRCLWYLFGAACLELFSNGVFIISTRLPVGDTLKYHDGNWVDWLMLGSMTCWSLAAFEYPVGRHLYSYSYATLAQNTRSRRDAHLAAELAEVNLVEKIGTPEMRFDADWTDWLASKIPAAWMVVKYGDETVATSILIPLSQDLKDRFVSAQGREQKMSERELLQEVRKNDELVWDWVYLAEIAVASGHRGRGIGYVCVAQTMQYISVAHPNSKLLCRPMTDEGLRFAQKIREGLTEVKVEIM